jgi:RNA polymerase sigma factor (sigma-70 family)
VRNTAYTWLKKNRPPALVSIGEEDMDQIEDLAGPGSHGATLHKADAGVLRAALEELPAEFREAIILREIEGFSYKEIAEVAEVPVGTVMSRLARGRKQLLEFLQKKGGLEK